MKKSNLLKNVLISLLIIPFTILTLVSCNQLTSNLEITCYEIEQVYKDYGYSTYHRHKNEEYDSCYMIFKENEESEAAIYFNVYDTIEEAKNAQKEEQWNLVLWFYAMIQGEARWKESKSYNNIQYSYFDSSLAVPFENLLN